MRRSLTPRRPSTRRLLDSSMTTLFFHSDRPNPSKHNLPIVILIKSKSKQSNMERHSHHQPLRSMRSALTKGLALTSAGTADATNLADVGLQGLHLAPCSIELKSCLCYSKTSVSSATRGPSSRKKTVCFALEVGMKNILPRTASLNNETWYSLEEERQFREEAMAAVKLRRHCASMSENDFEKTHNSTTQGLEHFLCKRLFSTFKGEQEAVIAAVAIIQEKMKGKGLPIDHEVLSCVSQVLSAPARARAYQKGLQHST